MTENDLAGAEDFLRRLATAPEGDMNDKLAVVEFLRQTKGNEAAKGELDALIAAEPDRKTYKALRSSIIYEEGDTATAIAEMEALLTNAEPDDETRNLKVTLARMLALSNDKVGARARVEEVIAEDPNHVEALKMQAGWLIDEDKPTEAILALRTALSQAPRDVSVITMMGQAHEREGARDLAGERYALAVEVSGRAPAESLRYASFLMADERMESAEAVLEDALQANPENVELISAMAEIKIRLRDWDSVTRSVWKLRSLETDPATAAANAIEAASLLQQERVEETLDFLGDLVQSEDSSVAAKAQMVQVQVRAGKLDEARDFLDSELAKTPDEPTLLYLRAGLHVLQNEPDQAETLYRKLIETQPQFDRPMYTLYGLMMGQGRTDDADALIDAALVSNPDNETALLMKAGRLEQRQDFNGAIEVYEKLYARDSSNLIVANNLASLITTHRADDASLERGYSIARRLKGSDVPAFQDTYGWIEYRRGNYEEALANLEPAAKGLPNDPLAQFHLGMTYLALNRKDEARATLEQALKIAGDSPLPQFDEARAELAKLGGN
jgi:predicted Zn-dependent protease